MTTIHQVWAVYFSATGSTGRVVSRLARELSRLLDVPCRTDDLTLPEARLKNRKYQEGDLVVFGLPVHRGRVPQHMLPCLRSIQGGGALFQGRGNIDVAIAPEAADGHKQAAGRRLPGVIANTGDVRLAGAGHARGRDLPQQIL